LVLIMSRLTPLIRMRFACPFGGWVVNVAFAMALALVIPSAAQAEFVVCAAFDAAGNLLHDGSSSGASPVNPDESPSIPEESPPSVGDLIDLAALPAGEGGCGASGSAPGSPHAGGSAVLSGDRIVPRPSAAGKLFLPMLLRPPRPDPLEMLDPPKSAC
jgi:hypothetical protein